MSETEISMVTEDVSKLSPNEKFEKYCSADPFPDIAPALLNGADVIKYANQVGLLEPFFDNQMNGVTYEVKLEGKARYWYYDNNNEVKKCEIYLIKESEKKEIDLTDVGKLEIIPKLTLEPNSITYVTLESTLRMPYYIIARFNLKVNYVYKGLLLGTGPIVDPGFVGRLSIPLHNLTNNKIELCAGDTLIAMEFTKISPNKNWDNTIITGEAAPTKKFSDKDTKGHSRDVFDYTDRALRETESTHIINDAPSQLRQTKAKITMLEEKIGQFERTITNITFGGVLGIVLTIMGLLHPTWTLINDVSKERSEFNAYRLQNEQDNAKIQEEIEKLKAQITNLTQQKSESRKGQDKND
jgi:deoxycytidine triphosphate deaminase